MVSHRRNYSVISSLILALILSACDPTSLPFTAVLQVASANDSIYAYSVESRSWGPGCCGYGDIKIYSSHDTGKSWQETATSPLQMQQKIAAASERYDQACDQEYPWQCTRVDGIGRAWRSTDGGETWFSAPTYYLFTDIDEALAFKSLDYQAKCSQTNPQNCYRLSQLGTIESSTDGGVNWKTDWQFPEGRLEYLKRSYARSRPGVPDALRPLDLAVLETNDGEIVVAAMGNQGVLIRTTQGQWESIAVESASPLPANAQNIQEALNMVIPEAGRAVVIAILFAIVLYLATTLTIHFLFRKTGQAAPRMSNLSQFVIFYPLILLLVLFLPYVLWSIGLIDSIDVANILCLTIGVLVCGVGLAHTILSAVRFSSQMIEDQVKLADSPSTSF